jgi:hypothetical protein
MQFWQRNYYEHIIRNDKELNNIRDYILNNLMQWHMDEENLCRDFVGTHRMRPKKQNIATIVGTRHAVSYKTTIIISHPASSPSRLSFFPSLQSEHRAKH